MTLFEEGLRAGAFPFALEITPPRRRDARILLRRARLLGDLPAAVDVIQRPDRLSSLDASCMLREAGLEPIWHLASRGATRVRIEAEIARAAESGISAVLCIRGDHDAADGAQTPTLRETVERVRRRLPSALIGVTANPYLALDRVLRNLLPKLRAGASFVQTQPVFELPRLRALVAEVRGSARGTWLVPMLMPLLSLDAAERIERRLAIPVPARLKRELERGGARAGFDAFRELLHGLEAEALADGVALMTPEMDAPAATAQALAAALAAVRDGRAPSGR